jgi:DNA polymerase III subunit delta'
MVAELEKAEEIDAVSASARLEKQPLDRILYSMQTWVHDLTAVQAGGQARFHIRKQKWFANNARSAKQARLFELDRRLAAAQRSVSHPLMPRLTIEQLLIAYSNVFR